MIKNQVFLLNDIVVQCAGNIVSDMGGEKVMLSVDNGKYYNLGQMGGEIWDLISVPISGNELVTELTSEYDVDRSECEAQVTSFLELLLKEDLIQMREAKLG